MRKKFAVFEGGGVKGVALVGALYPFQNAGIQFNGYAGTSAGAIVAALTAVGYPAWDPEGWVKTPPTRDQKKILEEAGDLRSFLEGRDEFPLERLAQLPDSTLKLVPDALKDLEQFLSAGWWRRARILPGLRKKYSALWEEHRWAFRLFGRIAEKKGVYETTALLNWLRGLLNEKGPRDSAGRVTFGTISVDRGVVLKIVASDLSSRRPRIYSVENTGAFEVASAVVASASIPLFFCPFPEGDSFLVDGGIMSNYAPWVFD